MRSLALKEHTETIYTIYNHTQVRVWKLKQPVDRLFLGLQLSECSVSIYHFIRNKCIFLFQKIFKAIANKKLMDKIQDRPEPT